MRAARTPEISAAIRAIDASIERAWQDVCARFEVAAGSKEAHALAEVVVDDPSEHPWRVADAALDVLRCAECGERLGDGRASCAQCTHHDRFRFAATETDRPGVPAGNEHALRVATAVVRSPHRYPVRARLGFTLVLPVLLHGGLPTTAQAQAARKLINALTAEECEQVTSMDEVTRLARPRLHWDACR